MRNYNNIITLSKNGRGIWDFDTIKGCKTAMDNNTKGCYNDCYSFKIANRYGINFSISIS